MKTILIVVALLISPLCVAKTSLKLTGELGFQIHAGQAPPPTLGIGLWQSLGKKVAYNTWTGMGHQARVGDPTVRWFATKHDLIYYWGVAEFGIGYDYKKAQQEKMGGLLQVDEHRVSLKVALKIL